MSNATGKQTTNDSVSIDADCSKAAHHPDRTRLPKKLQSLPWEANTDPTRLWEDGSRVLVAVPVCARSDQPRGAWFYEINVVSILCDEEFYTIEIDGEAWGWELSDVEFFVVL